MHDVADRVGVSAMTVSRVINGNRRVDEDTLADAIRSVEPQAVVLSGGMAPALRDTRRRLTPHSFLERLYDTGAMEAIDGVAYHPYSYPELPSVRTGRNGFIDEIGRLRRIMNAHGAREADIWLTEFGVPTTGGGSPVLSLQEGNVGQGRFERSAGANAG